MHTLPALFFEFKLNNALQKCVKLRKFIFNFELFQCVKYESPDVCDMCDIVQRSYNGTYDVYGILHVPRAYTYK